jgi:hypothetical protein
MSIAFRWVGQAIPPILTEKETGLERGQIDAHKALSVAIGFAQGQCHCAAVKRRGRNFAGLRYQLRVSEANWETCRADGKSFTAQAVGQLSG